MKHQAFVKQLKHAGAEILAISPGNPYEVMRFRTRYGVGVVWQNKHGKETWNREALSARDHLLEQRPGGLSPAPRKSHRRQAATGHEVIALLERDGDECFFCLKPLGEDITREHLVGVSVGGPHHLANKFLAHARCNHEAGNLSAVEKIKIRERALLARFAAAQKESA